MGARALKETALSAARRAGEILKEGFGKAHKFSLKSSRVDLVTEYDRRSEEAIIEIISGRVPNHGLLAEESPSSGIEAEYRWIIDPLDGTTNYTHNYPLFAVSIALERAGEIILGLVYSPILQELFLAERGGGATLNGEPIHVSRIPKLERALLATGFPYDLGRIDINLAYFTGFLHRAQAVRRDGSAALDLCYLACGRFDGFWEMDLRPWDVAAGALIVAEAGGRVSDFSGGELDIYGNEILASNGLIHAEMVRVLRVT
jgi:myo-inositol-1(or 4)-monophosphatase